jgi:hypothetical protein
MSFLPFSPSWSSVRECEVSDSSGPTQIRTVAVWVLHPANISEIRVVVPTSQIFLGVTDSFGTRKFNAWHRKRSSSTARRDAPDSFELPKLLFDLAASG